MSIVGGSNWIAGGTITKYRLLMLDSSNPEAELIHTSADTDVPKAVSTNAATATNPSALEYEILTPGMMFTVTASGAITAGAKVAPDSSGRVKAAATGDYYFAEALEAASNDGDNIVCVVSLCGHLLA